MKNFAFVRDGYSPFFKNGCKITTFFGIDQIIWKLSSQKKFLRYLSATIWVIKIRANTAEAYSFVIFSVKIVLFFLF